MLRRAGCRAPDTGPLMPRFRPLALLSALCALTAGPAADGQVARVSNTATLSFDEGGAARSVASNTVALDIERAKRPAVLNFRLPPLDYRLTDMRCDPGPPPAFTPAPVSADELARSAPLAAIDTRATMLLVLDAPGENRDASVRETAWIDVTTDTIRTKLPLFETGVDTGVFAAGVPGGGMYPELSACDPTRVRGDHLRLSFGGSAFSLSAEAALLIDPSGFVFDSVTGVAIDGATIALVDGEGRPATVFGDDGISRYPATLTSGGVAQDASGRAYRFGSGGYRFPLVAPGAYRLIVTPPPGYVAPSTRDRALLAAVRDATGRPYILNQASFGAPFDLESSDPFEADIPLDHRPEDPRAGPPRETTTLLLTKTVSIREASAGDFVHYRVTVENRGKVAASDVRLIDQLPAGLRLERASLASVSADGRTITHTVGTIPPNSTHEWRYIVSIGAGAPVGEAVNRIHAEGANVTGNAAAATVRLRPTLFADAFTVVGRVTEGACGAPLAGRKGVAGVRLLMEDGTFVVTDGDGLYHIEGIRPGRHVVQLDRATLPASHEPVACDDDTQAAGSGTSRFVEGVGGLVKRVDFQLRPTGRAMIAPDALPIAVASDARAAGAERDWFAGQAPGVALLFPEVDHNPRAPAVRVVVKHRPGQRVALSMNGHAVETLAYDGTDTNADDSVAIARWSGVPLSPGANRLEARVVDAGGRTVETLVREVRMAGDPARVVAVPARSRLVADGVTRPLLAVRATDAAGRPVRAGTLLAFRIDAPYAPAADAGLEQQRRSDGTAQVVGDDGYAFLALRPTTQAGSLRAHVDLATRDGRRSIDLRGWLSAPAGQWTVVGFGAGTIGHDMLARHARSLPLGERNRRVVDGELALYARGRIKGSWLATIGIDTRRQPDPSRGRLGTIDPDRYYTVYGDATLQGQDAPTDRKLYLRLERPDAYALFGDFETGLTATRLGRYSRTLNGAKAEYDNGRIAATAFTARTDDLYARDELRGSGLSGPYRLSTRGLVPNTDKVRIEVRDRLRPERIVSATVMTRHIDYDIDSAAGTIRFREPVLSRDPSFNPVYIVVDYEVYGTSRRRVAGGRAAVRLAGDAVEVGATALHDAGAGDMMTLDLRARAGTATELRAEAGTGGRGGLGAGRAWLAEGEHHGGGVDLLVYARQQDRTFGVGQQNAVEAGARRYGIDGRVQLAGRLSLVATGWHQRDLAGEGQRTAVDARLEWRRASGTIFAGGQLAQDRGLDGLARDSRLLTLGGTQSLLDGKLSLTGQTQLAPGGSKDSLDFPVRHQLSAAYRVTPGVRVIGGYEIADGRTQVSHTARVGFDVAPWTGARVSSTLNQQQAERGENGARTFAQYGFSQSLALDAHWTVDATLDATGTLRGRAPVATALVQPVDAAGIAQEDFTAMTLGAQYRAGRWTWNGRAEYRAGSSGDRIGLSGSVLRPLGEGRTMAGAVRWFTLAQGRDARAGSFAADLALAWRPIDSRWSLLQRVELRSDRADAGITAGNVLGVYAGGDTFQSTLRAIGNVAANYRSGAEGAGHGLEATLYYGAKWVRGRFGTDDLTGFTQVVGAEVRREIGARFDLGAQASVQHGLTNGTLAFSAGPSVGVAPVRDLWVSAGYNVTGYRDRDFEQDRYTRSGPYVTMRLKFDQDGIGRLLRRGR